MAVTVIGPAFGQTVTLKVQSHPQEGCTLFSANSGCTDCTLYLC